MKRIVGAVLLLFAALWTAYASDPKERRFITAGMSEGEVLARIGRPDTESQDTGNGAAETVKRWIYLPAPGDDQTTTTVVLKRGEVIDVIREITRQGPSAHERRFVCKGMSEGEVLAKIGRPDSESEDTGGAAAEKVVRWIYLPAPGDEETTTTVVFKRGAVIQVLREITR